MRFDRRQTKWLSQSRIGIQNFTASGSSTVVTTQITTRLTTAGDGGTAVPLQVATTDLPGMVVTSPDNLVIIVTNDTKAPIADSQGREVYGRITNAGSVYTLSYFVLNNGTESAYTFPSATAIDFYFTYQFEWHQLPRNANTAINTMVIQQDPAAQTGSNMGAPERLTVTATNTLGALSKAPSAAGNIFLSVNGKQEFATGASPSFSVSGTTVTWNPTNAEYDLLTGMDVYAVIW